MNDPTTSISSERHLAVDLHKHYLVVGGVNGQQDIVVPAKRWWRIAYRVSCIAITSCRRRASCSGKAIGRGGQA